MKNLPPILVPIATIYPYVIFVLIESIRRPNLLFIKREGSTKLRLQD